MVGMSEPKDPQVTFRQAIPTMLWTLGILIALTVVGAALGIKTPEQRRLDRSRRAEPDYKAILTQSTRR